MAKFYGKIGYATTEETAPDVWEDVVVERVYRGDILQNVNRWQVSDKVNDDITIENKLSIISDTYAYMNLSNLRYVVWMGSRWKVSKIEALRPRLILTIGGVYNGPTPRPEPETP